MFRMLMQKHSLLILQQHQPVPKIFPIFFSCNALLSLFISSLFSLLYLIPLFPDNAALFLYFPFLFCYYFNCNLLSSSNDYQFQHAKTEAHLLIGNGLCFFHFSSYIGTFSTRSSTLHTNTRAIFNNVSVCALLMSFLRCSYC